MEHRLSRATPQTQTARASRVAVNTSADPAHGADPATDGRRPRGVYGVGEEPDVRFSLANERTALAWVRTGLALVAGGVALTTLTHFEVGSILLLDLVAVIACLAGAGLATVSLLSWRRNERSLRQRLPLPAPVALTWLVAGVVIMGIVLGGYAVVQGLSRL